MTGRKTASVDIFLNIMRAEISQRFIGSVIGVFWSLINPAVFVLVYYVIFGIIYPNPIENFHLYVIVGYLHWILFLSILSDSCEILTRSENLIKKVNFPIILLVFAKIGVNLYFWSFAFIVYVLASPFLGGVFSEVVFVYPVFWILFLMFATGVSLILSIFYVYARDLNHLISVMLQLCFWLTPIVYSTKQVPETLQFLVQMNPVSYYILSFQDIFVYQKIPSIYDFIVLSCLSIAFITAGLITFKRFEFKVKELL